MRLRPLLPYVLVLLLATAVSAGVAGAATIDRALAQQMAAKSADEPIPVLMIFHDLPPIDREALAGRSDWRERRELLLGQLRPAMRRLQQPVLAELENPAKAAGVRRVRELWLAGALAFEAPASVISALAAQDVDATLTWDRIYPLDSGTRRPEDATAAEATGEPAAAVAATDTSWGVQWIGAPRVWRELGCDGTGVIVGHIDSGIDVDHPDLAGRLWVNPGEIAGNGLDDDGNGFIDDIHGWDFGADDDDPDDDSLLPGHGTHTAGTVAGDGHGGTLTGVAPGAWLMAAKVWQDNGAGGSLSTIWAAQQYCAENGARILTMSLGLSGSIADTYARNDRYNAANLRDAGVALFNSAGNDHFVADPPIELTLTARIPSPWSATGQRFSHTGGVITVGGTGYHNDWVYDLSSRGPAAWGTVDPWYDYPYNPGAGLTKPDVAAPAVGINSTTVGGGYSGDSWSGTSMACPHVAGVAALMLQRNPSLSPAGLDSLLQRTAVDLGPVGKDNDFGAGRIDAYAAVQAVPAVSLADLVLDEVLPDPTGDTVLDPGDVSPLAFRWTNASPVQDAVGAIGALAVEPNPYVTVVDRFAVLGSVAAGAGADNLADPFLIAVDPQAPQGFEFTLLLTVLDVTGFARTWDRVWYVGLPEYRTHDVGSLYLTVTDQGAIGYLSQARTEGRGIGYLDGGSALYLASFWAGTGVSYVCNRDFAVGGGDPAEWIAASEPNGRVRDLGPVRADQTFQSVFTDAGHPLPQPLAVRQTSLAFAGEPNDDYVILEYELLNEGATDLGPLYAGVFCDFDIGDSRANEGGTDPSRALTYMYEAGGEYYGIARLGGAAHNLTLISNPLYIYPLLYVEDGFKMRHLSGLISTAATDRPDDWSALTSVRLDLPAAGGTSLVAFAIVHGDDLADLQANVDAANAIYDHFATARPGPELPAAGARLAGNAPNPFNPSTTIRFGLAEAGPVDLAVYDLAGRRLRTLVSGARDAGPHEAVWDGRDDRGDSAPSGIYFARLVAEGRTLSRKMTLLK